VVDTVPGSAKWAACTWTNRLL